MKSLLILTVMALVALYLYWRLRPYLSFARRVLGVVRDTQRMEARGTPVNAAPRAAAPPARNETLALCATCGTWLPASRAVKLRASSATYCSHACLERAADAPARPKFASGQK